MSDVPTSARLAFRRMAEADLDAMAALLGDPRVMAHYPHPFSREEALAWIHWQERNYARDGFGLWILHDRDGGFVGDCGLTWQEIEGVEHLELGYHVVADRQGEGLATEAARACVELARGRGVDHLIAIIGPHNLASQRVAEKAGLPFDRRTTSRQGTPVVVHQARLGAAPYR